MSKAELNPCLAKLGEIVGDKTRNRADSLLFIACVIGSSPPCRRRLFFLSVNLTNRFVMAGFRYRVYVWNFGSHAPKPAQEHPSK